MYPIVQPDGVAGERPDRVAAVRRELAEHGPPRSPDGGPDFATVTLPERDCDQVRNLLVEEQVGTVVEIGLAYASSALAISEALLRTPEAGVDGLRVRVTAVAGARGRGRCRCHDRNSVRRRVGEVSAPSGRLARCVGGEGPVSSGCLPVTGRLVTACFSSGPPRASQRRASRRAGQRHRDGCGPGPLPRSFGVGCGRRGPGGAHSHAVVPGPPGRAVPRGAGVFGGDAGGPAHNVDDGGRAGLRQAPRLLPSRAAGRVRFAVLAGHRASVTVSPCSWA